MGPFDRWPTGHGFDYFYGFIAGETSQWEPRLYQNLNPIEPPDREGYHLSEDLADNAISWLRQHRAYAADRPFFMYLGAGRRARAAPCGQGVGRQVRGRVRRRLGRLPRVGLRPAEGHRLDPRRGRTDPAGRLDATGEPDIKNGRGTPGTVTLFVDGTQFGHGEFPVTTPIRLAQGGAMLVGADTGAPVTPDYDPQFRFDGRIHRVIVDVSGEHVEDHEAPMRIALAKPQSTDEVVV